MLGIKSGSNFLHEFRAGKITQRFCETVEMDVGSSELLS